MDSNSNSMQQLVEQVGRLAAAHERIAKVLEKGEIQLKLRTTDSDYFHADVHIHRDK